MQQFIILISNLSKVKERMIFPKKLYHSFKKVVLDKDIIKKSLALIWI